MLNSGGGGWMVEGSPPRLLRDYNQLVDAYNRGAQYLGRPAIFLASSLGPVDLCHRHDRDGGRRVSGGVRRWPGVGGGGDVKARENQDPATSQRQDWRD